MLLVNNTILYVRLQLIAVVTGFYMSESNCQAETEGKMYFKKKFSSVKHASNQILLKYVNWIDQRWVSVYNYGKEYKLYSMIMVLKYEFEEDIVP